MSERRFQIKWEIDVWAENEMQAIQKAVDYFPRMNEDTTATIFEVKTFNPLETEIVETRVVDIMYHPEINIQK